MTEKLSLSEMKLGKRYYNLFQAISSIAMPLVNGAVITLYAIKVGASSTLIGLIASFNYLSFLAVPLGKIFVSHLGAIRLYGWGMTLRFIFIIPILFIPLFLHYQLHLAAYSILTVSSIGFNFFRGMAMLGQNPVVDQICTTDKDRSLYLAITMIIVFLFTIVSNLFLAFALKLSHDSLLGYTLIITLGIILGFLAGYYLLKMPKTAPVKEKTSVFAVFKAAYSRFAFRRFIITYFFVSFVMGLTRPFIVVYAKGPYMQTDSNAILLTTIAALGSFIMGLFSRMLINLVGSKTLYIFFMAIATLSLLPAVASPAFSGLSIFIFLAIFHFFAAFGMQGVESNSQTYFFTVVRQDEIVELSIIYFVIYGIGGALGSTLGGALLDFFPRFLGPFASFQLFFALSLVSYIIVLFFLFGLKNTGRHSVRDGLGFILSLKDMKAINLANKLESTTSAHKQGDLLHELAHTDSDAPIDLLVESLGSPRLFVRREALFALENIPPTKDPDLVDALLHQLRSYPYTTAYMAARILGRNKIKKAVPILRVTLNSPDYHLKAESIRALGRLGDKESISKILHSIRSDANPYVAIQAINALERLCTMEQVSMIFRPFKWIGDLSPALADEAILSAASILELNDWLYKAYITFLKDQHEGFLLLTDYYISKKKKIGQNNILEELLALPHSLHYYKLMKEFIKQKILIPNGSEKTNTIVSAAALNPVLFRYAKIRFLFTAIALSSYLHHSAKRKP